MEKHVGWTLYQRLSPESLVGCGLGQSKVGDAHGPGARQAFTGQGES